MKTVGIIGAGAAGLCALRHVLDTPGLTPLIWDQAKEIGGLWVYTDKTLKDEFGLPVHSSMYKSLQTDIPKEIMMFPDFAFENKEKSYIHNSEVLNYLRNYAQHFDLLKHIKFSHMVKNVTPVSPGSPDSAWHVTVLDLTTKQETTHVCQALLVCNGHFSTPNLPILPNEASFAGTMKHSHSYREPHPYVGRVVAVLGASASGVDIALELATVARQVYLCHNWALPFPTKLPQNVQQRAGIVSVKLNTSDTVVLKDGSELKVDDVLYCTGYLYSFPFLSPECGITVTDNQVRPLYRHLINCMYPTMAFIGIPSQICPFPLFHVQVLFTLHSLLGTLRLPNKEDMMIEEAKERAVMEAMGETPQHLHGMMRQGRLWRYHESLLRDIIAAQERLVSSATNDSAFLLESEYMAPRVKVSALPSHPGDILPHMRDIWNTAMTRRLLQVLEYHEYDYEVVANDDCRSAVPTKVKEVRDQKLVQTGREITWLLLSRIPPLIFNNIWAFSKLVLSMCYYSVKKMFM